MVRGKRKQKHGLGSKATQHRANSKVTRSQSALKQCLPLTAEAILEDMGSYRLARSMTRVAIVGCIISVTGALLLRFNIQGYTVLPLFLNVLSYVFAGSALFLWLARLRPMRKHANQQAMVGNRGELTSPDTVKPLEEEQASCYNEDNNGSCVAYGKTKDDKTGIVTQPDGATVYKRARRLWRVMLAATAALVVAATYCLSAFPDQPVVAITLQMLALLPIAAALYLYRTRLRPLKAEWQKRAS